MESRVTRRIPGRGRACERCNLNLTDNSRKRLCSACAEAQVAVDEWYQSDEYDEVRRTVSKDCTLTDEQYYARARTA